MYAYPIYLPEFSNREDLLLTVALFDDDTGDAIDMSGVTRAIPGAYTNNLWLVTDGPYVTISNSVLTIPDYPIGDELQAVSLVVDPNLPIMPGDPVSIASLPGGTVVQGPFGPPPDPYVTESGANVYVTEDSQIFPPVPSSLVPGPNSMTGYVTSYAAATGALVVQIGNTFQFEIRRLKERHDFDFAYTSSWDWFGTADHAVVLSASLGNGLTMTGTGMLQINIPESQIRKLCHRTYGAALTMTDSQNTRQVFIARLPFQYGGVSL
jgi:hypothetical protein